MTEPSLDRRRRALKATALGIRFVLELCIACDVGNACAGTDLGASAVRPSVLRKRRRCMAVWGAFLSPKRKYEIGASGRLILEAGFFAGSALILICLGWPALAIVLVITATTDRLALALIP
ncbi:DUF2568 domain-containing protein [Rhizobium sp. ICMP 5592]|uniref:DUF2568 domain-containing protein n=1 Tax=Rhizobium sp. ICMP 5592 TaxID=2292445 RepID=UPI001297F609|nr:DUF2568 domain-containing protein [Rhizobium sp. ICMP 5592]MQB45010.1 DUF2568 domain-containing protein [Rhizobium sp. ICMP 5592]